MAISPRVDCFSCPTTSQQMSVEIIEKNNEEVQRLSKALKSTVESFHNQNPLWDTTKDDITDPVNQYHIKKAFQLSGEARRWW